MKILNRKRLIALTLALCIIASVVMANSFYFNYTSTPYQPDQYSWKQPWAIHQMTDFVEATLDIVGSAYQQTSHLYNLTLKNIAAEPSFVLLGCNYVVKFETSPTVNETLISGTHSSPLLYVNNSTKKSGTFVPTLYGSGNVSLYLSNITWGIDTPITWATSINNTYSTQLTIASFAIAGASRTYIPGNVTFTMTAMDLQATRVSFQIKIVETGQIIRTETDYILVKDVPMNFNYAFTPTIGGSLTMRLTITNAHAP